MARNLEHYVKQKYRGALERQEIEAYYQPVIRTASKKLCSFEALARWNDPSIGMIYPDEFIPVLEKNQVIHELDAAILGQVCRRLRSSIVKGETPIPVSVNLSRLDFTLCDIFAVVDKIVSEYKIPHDFLYFEITESVMAEEMDMMKGIIDRFRSAGYQIWMDDFGSAYSSLNILKEISFDEIKLDMCFLRPFNQISKRIATSVVEMAKAINIHTLVEGVETEEQFNFLHNIGCEKVQGYFFGRPMPYEEAMLHLENKEIAIELPQDRRYYDEIGRINILSSVPFMSRKEQDAIVTARDLNSIPLVLVEFFDDHFEVLFYNTAFEEMASGTELFSFVFSQEMLCKPISYNLISDRIINLVDSVREGGDGRMLFTSHEEYYEVRVRNMATTRDRYCVLMQMTNLSKVSQSERTGYLDEYARRIYVVYERITLMNIKENRIRPLYTTTQLDLLSGRTGLQNLAEEYAEKYIYPDDREDFLKVAGPKAIVKFFKDNNQESMTGLYRTSIRHGRYAWKVHTILKADENNFLLLVRNVNDSIVNLLQKHAEEAGIEKAFSPSLLWHDLVRSDIIRLFWKDADRRFVGASKAFLDYYGFESLDEIVGKNDEDLGWHVHPESYMNDEVQVIREGVTTHNIPGLCLNDGENKEILASKTPLYDENGQINGLMGYFIDRELLTVNDKRGKETTRRDLLTGLLNSRGISEEALVFRDEYYLRGVDFIRVHISIDEMDAINEQYGFDFGDKILNALGYELRREFGRRGAVGRYTGHKFVVLHQVTGQREADDIISRIRFISRSIGKIEGVPITLYISIGYMLFTECFDLEEQSRTCDAQLAAEKSGRSGNGIPGGGGLPGGGR